MQPNDTTTDTCHARQIWKARRAWGIVMPTRGTLIDPMITLSARICLGIRLCFSLIAVIALVILSGCAANADPLLPTVRPSATITQTPPASPTPPIPVTTLTRTPAPTLTPLPPPTEAPLVTITPGPSPTALIAATSISRPLPARSPTRRVAQPGSLVIEFFTTDATSARPGEKIRVYWSIKGAESALIYRVKADGTRDFTWTVGRAGSMDVATGEKDKDSSRFVLTVGDSFTRIEQSITVNLKCASVPWYFEPAPEACAEEPFSVSSAASQNFERGRMLWLGAQGQIYVLLNDGKQPTWLLFADEYKDGAPDRDDSLKPPPGLGQPIRGFGLVWRTKDKLRERLGWSVDSESGFETAYQRGAGLDSTLYIRGRDGTVYALAKDATWTAIGARTPSTMPAAAIATPKK